MIPTVDYYRSTRMKARTGDLFNPPGLTNFLGSLQAASCVMGIQHLTFPPFSQGDTQIGILTVNGSCVQTSGHEVTFVWQPDRLERSVKIDGLEISTVTVMGVRKQTVTIALTVRNRTSRKQNVDLRIQTGGGVIHSIDGWKTPYSPKEGPSISVTPWEGEPPPESLTSNQQKHLAKQRGIHYASRTSTAHSIQAGFPSPDSIDRSWLDYSFNLGAKKSKTIYFHVAVGDDPAKLKRFLNNWLKAPSDELAHAENDWNAEIEAVFSPGNSRYSGHLPTLHSKNRDLQRIYHNTVISVVYLKRDHPESAYGKTYATLMPRYWVATSFINDWSMSAYLLAMLDPHVLRTTIEMWLTRDIYSHFGTDYVSGTNSGNWYSCNDYAMTRLISAYVRVTGDTSWLRKEIASKSVIEHVRAFATHFKDLDNGSGLADYGDRNSLLEAVGAYTHEVASLNAANIWILRETAALFELLDEEDSSSNYRRMANQLVGRVQELYIHGSGFWACRQPDGKLVPVRHAWDFVHTLNFMLGDLSEQQVDEMVLFFERELMRPNWMAALSANDEDIGFSLRLDHEWNGSWPGWVALATSALMKTGRHELLKQWLPGLAMTTNQGPWSQGYFVPEFASSIDGGARKGPTEWPFINDWATVCVGGFFETVLYEMFGIEHSLEADLVSIPAMSEYDSSAWLDNVPHHGELYTVHAS